MTDCMEIYDILVDYVNDRLEQKDKFRVVAHLVECSDCRKEAAFLIRLKNEQMNNLKEIPKSLKKTAFDLIPEERPQSGHYLEQFFDSLRLFGQTVRFVQQII